MTNTKLVDSVFAELQQRRNRVAELEEALRDARYYVRIAYGSDRAAELSARIARLLGGPDA